MAWHLMMTLHDVRDGDGGDIQYSVGGGYALLDDAGYHAWQRRETDASLKVPARFEADSGGWRRPVATWAAGLDTLHRVAKTLKEAKEGEGLPVDDTDRFCAWYWALDPASVAFFEKHLRRDPETERALAGLQAMDPMLEAADEVVFAACAAMFARAGAVLGKRRGVDYRDPSALPGSFDEEVLDALRGWRDEASALSECEPWPDTSRSAAALVHMAFAGFPAMTKCPAWVRKTLKAAEIEGLGAGMTAARRAARLPSDDRSWMRWE